MAFVSSIDVIGSGFTAQQLRLDVISENIVNMNTTRTENGEGPYRRKVVTFQAADSDGRFRSVLARRASLTQGASWSQRDKGGVIVSAVGEDPSDFKLKYDPEDPDANEDGYVEMPNVDMVKEIADAMAATQAFTSNVTMFNTMKTVVTDALQIGK